MKIKLGLDYSRLAKFPLKELLVPEEEVILEFVSDTYVLGTLAITVRNSEEERKYKTSGTPIDVTELCRKAGFIEAEIDMTVNCKSVKKWRTDKLLLREIEHGFEAVPELEAIKEDVKTLKAAIRDLAALLAEKNI